MEQQTRPQTASQSSINAAVIVGQEISSLKQRPHTAGPIIRISTTQKEQHTISNNEVKIKEIDLGNYYSLPENPFVFIRNQVAPKSRPQTASKLETNRFAERRPLNRPKTAGTEFSNFGRPVTLKPWRSPCARQNLETYRLEEIALRRLRYVVDNDIVGEEHLQMLAILDDGDFPNQLVQNVFGIGYNGLADVRQLLGNLLGNHEISQPKTSVSHYPTRMKGNTVQDFGYELPFESRSPSPRRRRKIRVTTPKPILDILAIGEGRNRNYYLS